MRTIFVQRAARLLASILLVATVVGLPRADARAIVRPPAPAAANDPFARAIAGIDHAEAIVAAAAAKTSQSLGPVESEQLLRRVETATAQVRLDVGVLAADLASGRLVPAQRAAASAHIIRGGRIIADATDVAARLRASRGQRLASTIATHGPSPFASRYWSAVAATLPDDVSRLSRFMAAQANATWRGLAQGGGWTALLGLLGAIGIMLPVRRWLRRAGHRFMIDRIPQSRLRRSGWALWIAVLGIGLPWLAICSVYEGFAAAGMISAPWRPFAIGIIRGVAVAAAASALAGALLQRDRSSWRLLPVSDRTAGEVRPWTMLAAIAVFVTVVVDELLAAAAIGTASSDVMQGGEALLNVTVFAGLLTTINRARRRADRAADDADGVQDQPGEPAGSAAGEDVRRGLIIVALGLLLGWLMIAASVAALAAGYVALSLLVSRMLVWLPLVVSILYLTSLVIDDLASEVVSGDGALGRSLHHAFGIRPSLVDQIGVALSAILRILLLAVAGIAAFAPFGSNLGELAGLAHGFSRGLTIGQITIAPGAIMRALAVLAAAIFLVRIVEHWLDESYLPKTELDDGARNSVSTVARYVGFILAALWSLAALGIGFERIALVLSALSVGIGFGLQAITQNFISGLILLVERPVKIGDLVEVGGQKGDVKRISVRATEITTSDRSTLIVPNSELITKTIRNLTHADPMGVIQLKFTVPLDSDVDAVRQLVLDLFKEATAVLDTPESKVFIDSIDDGSVHFNSTAYCASPRIAYATRSDVLFRLIAELRNRGIAIGSSTGTSPGDSGSAPGSAGVIGNGD